MKNKLFATTVATPAILFSTLLLTHSQIASADTVTVNDDGGLQLSITANRRPQSITDTLVPVTVITREEIDRSQATELTDVLRKVPGLTIKNSGGLGKETSVSIRGTSSSHVLVLVDGVMIGSATLGYAAFEDISLNNVERIEVLRGPRSALYGSEAIGGVIQIITRKGKQGFHPEFSISAGSNNTLKSSANFSGGNKNNWYNFNIGSQKSKGIDAQNGSTHTELDRDGYRREEASLNIGHNFKNGSTATLRLQKSFGKNDYDGFLDSTKFNHEVLSTKITAPLGEKNNLTFVLGQSKDDSDNFKSGVFSSTYNTKRHTASLQLESSFGRSGVLVSGVDWQKDHIETTNTYARNTRKNTGLFAAYQNQLGKTDFELSLRQDDNEQFGKKLTGGIALGYSLDNGIRLRSSYGTAYKAPTFNSLYAGGGNPDLKEESSNNIELGIQGNLSGGKWEVNAYKNEIENLIAWAPIDPNNPGGAWTPSNINKVKIKGIEANYQTTINNWDVNTSLSLLDAKNGDDKKLRYRPTKALNIDIDRKFGRWNIGSSLHAESARFTDVANTDELKGFATLDLRTQYELNKDWSVGIKVNNVFDKEYETNKGYNQDGINGMLTLKYSPK